MHEHYDDQRNIVKQKKIKMKKKKNKIKNKNEKAQLREHLVWFEFP